MATTHGTNQATPDPLWRWRRNDLRRRSDRAEAWMLLSAWVLAVAGGAAAGAGAASAVVDSTDAMQADRHEVTAVVSAQAAPRQPAEADFGDNRVSTPVHWTGNDGRVHTANARVAPDSKKDTPVRLWVDNAGHLTSSPPSPGEQFGGAAATGGMTALGVGGAVLLSERLARFALDRRRLREWEREWAVVGPTWRRSAR